jgi:hypothetical protein
VLDHLVDIVFHLGVSSRAGRRRTPQAVGVRGGGLALRHPAGRGRAVLYVFVGPVKIQPTAFGRLTGVVMVALGRVPRPGAHAERAIRGAARAAHRDRARVLLAATVVQVVLLGWYNLRIMRGAAAVRVVGRRARTRRRAAPARAKVADDPRREAR